MIHYLTLWNTKENTDFVQLSCYFANHNKDMASMLRWSGMTEISNETGKWGNMIPYVLFPSLYNLIQNKVLDLLKDIWQ